MSWTADVGICLELENEVQPINKLFIEKERNRLKIYTTEHRW